MSKFSGSITSAFGVLLWIIPIAGLSITSLFTTFQILGIFHTGVSTWTLLGVILVLVGLLMLTLKIGEKLYTRGQREVLGSSFHYMDNEHKD